MFNRLLQNSTFRLIAGFVFSLANANRRSAVFRILARQAEFEATFSGDPV